MINRPKENDMNDLDQSDVNRDAAKMMEDEMTRLGEGLDGIDPFTVLSIWADKEGVPALEFLNSVDARDLLQYTQSNPSIAHERIKRMMELDQALSDL